ncbi:sulfatase [Aestuariibaculum sp. M13]|uniref:sulfatase family protein n=1 Tax=Aestuariibaculum sp. M13 TaxID=2967132 RepID=UPI002159E23F|nr:sulfatase [Aestuariibaculum sp. M13]MCR8667731.1 sulfatase [Aestuariibaculum sp. M13]
MNFKKFSTLTLSLSLLISCGKANKTQDKTETTSKRPNIIFIMSDDHAYQAISAYSDKLTTTPNIDRIANDGILFTNASVTNSICAPSRATILTGKHTHINGKIDNLSPFDTTQVTFPQLFQKAGYQTAMFGKLHFGNSPKGVDDFMILPGQGNYINPDFITTTGEIVKKEGYATDIITDMSIEWMDKKRDTTKPFLLMYLHKAPHRAWWPKPDRFKAYSQRTFLEPESLFDDYSNRGTAAKTSEMNILNHMLLSYDLKVFPETVDALGANTDKRNTGMFNHGDFSRMNEEQKALYMPILDAINKDFKDRWPTMTDEDKMRWKYQRYMQDYLACISTVDDNIGRVLDYLEDHDLEDNTIVVYTSDQGFYLGEHGWFDKRFMYNESFRTPLMIKWPNQIEPGITSDEMVQNLDFAQTFLEAAGIAIPDDMQGESLMPLLTGKTEEWTRDGVYYHYYEYPAEHSVKRHYGIATKEFKLIHFYYDVDEWELYDLKNDPQEMNNVYNHPDYAEVVTRLKKELAEMRVKYKDSDELDEKFINRYKEKRNQHY